MIGLPDVLALAMLLSLILYVLLGGADFGGGIWDLLASGSRASEQRRAIEAAIAPVWEANHVWLILVIVLLFTCFPLGFSVASIALHVPLTLMLFGIVLRGSAFVFRQYGGREQDPRWGLVFAVASLVTPFFLGVSLGAITSGAIRVEDEIVTSGMFETWVARFPVTIGAFTLALFAFLAAVYLAVENADDPALSDDFRFRALVSGVAVALLASLVASTADPTMRFREALLGSWWSAPLQIATGLSALFAFLALWTRRLELARVCAIFEVSLIVLGWGLAQRPYIVAPDITLHEAAAPRLTLELVAFALALGSLLLFPSLAGLFRVFKLPRRP